MPKGLKVCMGSACFARGNAQNLQIIEEYIKKNHLETKIEIIGQRCTQNCADGPNIFINGEKFSNITKEKLLQILEGL